MQGVSELLSIGQQLSGVWVLVQMHKEAFPGWSVDGDELCSTYTVRCPRVNLCQTHGLSVLDSTSLWQCIGQACAHTCLCRIATHARQNRQGSGFMHTWGLHCRNAQNSFQSQPKSYVLVGRPLKCPCVQAKSQASLGTHSQHLSCTACPTSEGALRKSSHGGVVRQKQPFPLSQVQQQPATTKQP